VANVALLNSRRAYGDILSLLRQSPMETLLIDIRSVSCAETLETAVPEPSAIIIVGEIRGSFTFNTATKLKHSLISYLLTVFLIPIESIRDNTVQPRVKIRRLILIAFAKSTLYKYKTELI